MTCPACTTELNIDGTCPACIAYDRRTYTTAEGKVMSFGQLTEPEKAAFGRIFGEAA